MKVAEEKKSKKEMDKLVQETGRVMYMIKSLDEDIYEELKRMAQEQGVSVTELIFDFVKKQLFLRKIAYKNLTVEQLLTAWDILKEMMFVSARIYTQISTMFFSEMTEGWSALLDEKAKKILEKERKAPDRFAEFTLKLLEPILQQLIWRIMAIGMATSSGSQAATQLQPQLPKLNVPVEVIEKES